MLIGIVLLKFQDENDRDRETDKEIKVNVDKKIARERER